MNKKDKIWLVGLVLILLLASGLTYVITKEAVTKDILTHLPPRDTVTKVKTQYDTTEIVKWRTHTEWITQGNVDSVDTTKIIESHPYHASKDTILNGDTIGLGYAFPMRIFDLSIKYRPDSIQVINRVDSVFKYIPTVKVEYIPRSTWDIVKEHAPTFILSTALGIIIGQKMK